MLNNVWLTNYRISYLYTLYAVTGGLSIMNDFLTHLKGAHETIRHTVDELGSGARHFLNGPAIGVLLRFDWHIRSSSNYNLDMPKTSASFPQHSFVLDFL